MENKVNIENIDIEDVYEFMQTGDVKDAPEEIVRYLTLLDKIHGMQSRIRIFGTANSVIKHLQITEDLSRYKASQLYYEALEYFHRDISVSKPALRNIYAEKLENLITAATIVAENTSDFDKVSRMVTRLATLQQLDVPDPPQFPKELLERPYKVYAMDAEFLGEEKINRTELARQIDELPDHSVNEKLALRQDAAIDQIILLPDEQKDVRKLK